MQIFESKINCKRANTENEFLSFEDVALLKFKSLAVVKKSFKEFTPAFVTKTNKYYFSNEQVNLVFGY